MGVSKLLALWEKHQIKILIAMMTVAFIFFLMGECDPDVGSRF